MSLVEFGKKLQVKKNYATELKRANNQERRLKLRSKIEMTTWKIPGMI
jgi:hypothetical protein